MAKIKQLILNLAQKEHASILLLLLIVLILHLATIVQPPKPVFDEQFYVPAARTILHGGGSDRIEHPPLAQLLIASGIRLLGDNPVGWRLFPVIFGIVGLFSFYFTCRQLALSRRYSYVATFLLSFENLTFIQSSVAMLDVFSLTFMLASFWFFLRGLHTTAGISIGLATLSKLSGILAIPAIFLYWLFTDRRQIKPILITLATAILTFWLLMPLLEYVIWHQWLNPFEQVKFMLEANVGSTFASYPSDMLSRPWEWLLQPKILTYYVEPHYLAMISPPIWVFIIPTIIFVVADAFRKNKVALFSLVWFTSTYLLWIPVSLITDRMSYIFYFYPSVGAVCIGLSLIINKFDDITKNSKTNVYSKLISFIVPVCLLIILGAFVILSPISYWWKVPLSALACIATRYFLAIRTNR